MKRIFENGNKPRIDAARRGAFSPFGRHVLRVALISALLLLCCCGARGTQFADAPATASPTASAAPTGTPSPEPVTPSPAPTATPSPTATPQPTPFRFVWFSDTQTYSFHEELQSVFPTMCTWVAENAEAKDLVVAVHTGDITENGWKEKCWISIDEGLAILQGKLPFLAIAGNHDLGYAKQDFGAYLERDFVKAYPAETVYEEGKGCYLLLQAGGTEFIIAGLGWKVVYDMDAADWLATVFSAHPNAVGVLLTHSYLTETGGYSGEGRRLRDNVVSRCKNIRLVLCGHNNGALRHTDQYDDDGDGTAERSVNIMMYNCQGSRSLDHVGYLRLLTFDPLTRSILVTTYSPFCDDYLFDDAAQSEEQFTLYNAF